MDHGNYLPGDFNRSGDDDHHISGMARLGLAKSEAGQHSQLPDDRRGAMVRTMATDRSPTGGAEERDNPKGQDLSLDQQTRLDNIICTAWSCAHGLLPLTTESYGTRQRSLAFVIKIGCTATTIELVRFGLDLGVSHEETPSPL